MSDELRQRIVAEALADFDTKPHANYERTLARVLSEHGKDLTGVLVGVYDGKLAARLLAAVPSLTLSCVDTWAAEFPAIRDERRCLTPRDMREIKQAAITRIKGFRKRGKVVNLPSLEAAAQFAEGTLDFVILTTGPVEQLAAWALTVKPGGLFLGTNYGSARSPWVKPAVDLFAAAGQTMDFSVTRLNGKVWLAQKPAA